MYKQKNDKQTETQTLSLIILPYILYMADQFEKKIIIE